MRNFLKTLLYLSSWVYVYFIRLFQFTSPLLLSFLFLSVWLTFVCVFHLSALFWLLCFCRIIYLYQFLCGTYLLCRLFLLFYFLCVFILQPQSPTCFNFEKFLLYELVNEYGSKMYYSSCEKRTKLITQMMFDEIGVPFWNKLTFYNLSYNFNFFFF